MAGGILGPDGVIDAPYELYNDTVLATWHSQRMAARGITATDDATVLSAYINDSRWVADCSCGSGLSVDADTAKAYCFGCGKRFVAISIPANRAAIEDLLLVRPNRHNRNWVPGETEADLAAENTREGVG